MIIAYAVLNVALVVSVAFRAVRCVQISGTGLGIMVVWTSDRPPNELWPWLVLGISIACISLTYRPNWSTINDDKPAARVPSGNPRHPRRSGSVGDSFFADTEEMPPAGGRSLSEDSGVVLSKPRQRHRLS